ncbi:hypothetical protein DPMN_102510 [Dreissena polymorpha]|uniref:Peptidase S1 domain-containing protein n=1 Tax=Dreissena polymorpha TaxID=45954 RepID=A0A9D4LKH5_DREPO|nr:hypothetical protein DPMN_102510 [Dreissena polymorpha]
MSHTLISVSPPLSDTLVNSKYQSSAHVNSIVSNVRSCTIPKYQTLFAQAYFRAPDKRILYDNALVKFSSPAHMSEFVNTICIKPNYTARDHSHCVNAGWGDLVDGMYFFNMNKQNS